MRTAYCVVHTPYSGRYFSVINVTSTFYYVSEKERYSTDEDRGKEKEMSWPTNDGCIY